MTKIRGFEEVIAKHMKATRRHTNIPKRSDIGSAGYDFYAKETAIINPGEKHLFWTDIKSYMKLDEVLSIHVRSSIGIKKGLSLANTIGIIDSTYYENKDNDGNIGICLKNTSDETVTIKIEDRIAQGIFQKYLTIDDERTLNTTRTGGIGSTGK